MIISTYLRQSFCLCILHLRPRGPGDGESAATLTSRMETSEVRPPRSNTRLILLPFLPSPSKRHRLINLRATLCSPPVCKRQRCALPGQTPGFVSLPPRARGPSCPHLQKGIAYARHHHKSNAVLASRIETSQVPPPRSNTRIVSLPSLASPSRNNVLFTTSKVTYHVRGTPGSKALLTPNPQNRSPTQTSAHLQNGDVKGAASQVKHQDGLVALLVQTIGQGRCSGFVDDAQHVKPRNPARVLCCLGGRGEVGRGRHRR